MAPMAGITNLPFRLMVKRLGAALVTTEMISAVGLVRGQKKTRDYLRTHPEERPLAVQIFGTQPDMMAEAARIAVEAGAAIIDINLGCPAKKVLRAGAGGALLRNPVRVKEILSAVRLSCPVPLTVKMRAGWSPSEPVACQIAKLAEDCGADAVTVHPRYVTQGFSGHADWDLIAKVKECLRIPCIGNGDVFHPGLAIDMKNRTGCDGVMVGRAAIGNPWIFRQILELERGAPLQEPTLLERKALLMEHFRHLSEFSGEHRAAKMMRGLLIWYTRGLPNSSRFRGSINRIKDLSTLISAMDQYFSLLEVNNN